MKHDDLLFWTTQYGSQWLHQELTEVHLLSICFGESKSNPGPLVIIT